MLGVILTKVNAIAKAVAPREGNNGLVDTGEQQPDAPNKLQIGANPGKWDGTRWDPIPRDKRISNQAIIANFESLHRAGEFVTGTLADWYKKDPQALLRYLKSEYEGVFEMANLSDGQRKFLSE